MKIMVAGLGSIGQRHVRNVRALLGRDVEIIAYRVRKLSRVLTERFEIESGRTVEEKYDIRTYEALDQALAQRPDVVFVCNPSSLHLSVALAAAQTGCHLFIEKPLSDNYDRIEELIDLVHRNKLTALVGYQMRFHPCLQRLCALLRQNVIGRVVS